MKKKKKLKTLQVELEEQERTQSLKQYDKERAILNDINNQLRLERRISEPTPEYLSKSDNYNKLYREFNKRWNKVFS